MTKDTVAGIIRAILTVIGTALIGHNLGFLGAVTTELWQVVVGSVITLFSIIWGIVTKDTGPEQFQSLLRSLVVSIGGFLVAAGLISGATLDAILGLLVAVIPVLQKKASAETAKQVADPNNPITADPRSGKIIKPAP